MKDLKRAFNSSALRRVEMEKIERLLDSLNQTYTQPVQDVPRLLLGDPRLTLTRIYVAQKKAAKSMKSAVKVLTSLGFVVVDANSSHIRFAIVKWGLLVDHLVKTFLHLRTAFTTMGAREDSGRAEEYARTTYKTIIGEDVSFNAIYE